MNIGIIGYGSMGRMIAGKIASAKNTGGKIFAANRTPSKLENLPAGITACSNNASLASMSDVVIVCTRPSDMKTVLEEIKAAVNSDKILVSLNGSISFEMINKIIPAKTAKVIPSVTAEVNRSQTLVSFNDLIRKEDKDTVKEIFFCMGNVIELSENEMGMGSELVSCMPGFIASIFDVVCQSAKKHTSIPEPQIVNMVMNTLCATGELMLEKKMSFGTVVERVATKGGITEEGTKVVYENLPLVMDELFEKTLAKRKLTAQKAQSSF